MPASAPLVVPQFGIFAQGTDAHHFLEFDLREDVTPHRAVASFRRLRMPQVSAGGVNLVVAFGSQLWRDVAPSMAPASLSAFREITGPDRRRAPATQHDVWLWISGSRSDVTWDHARAAVAAVDDVARLAAERSAFTYRNGHDMTGFIDGTANPPVRRAAEVALVSPGEAGEGGSHVLAMRWVHDLEAFGALATKEQERVIGRTKADSRELSGHDLPSTAHIARVQIRDGADELQIYRRSVPYGPIAVRPHARTHVRCHRRRTT
jgi:putative iron-dependent peroxidase